MIKKQVKSIKDGKILKDFARQYKANKESVAKLEELRQCVIEIFNTKFSEKEREEILSEEKDKYMQLVTKDGIVVNDLLTLKNDMDEEALLKLAMAKGYLYDVAKVSLTKLAKFASPQEIEKNVIGTSIIEKIIIQE